MKKQVTILSIIIALLLGVLFFQHQSYINLVKMLEQQDTTFVTHTEVDTIFFEKEYRDTVPQVTTVTVIQRDTLYRQVDDSVVEATPVLISFKKKVIPILYK